ncbi:Facilitated trehalose transporter Tret1 [Phytophthora citrophthora]|uniref:Facilitated trehalose transporter Tret1 n=1 Tax=Phytophthora citrophthora TaxID=4793 RepID=A0AAD9GQ12_9STRA|nr:Facilitated trehalose transporter Tret1 [Phytophthora citrophthora]
MFINVVIYYSGSDLKDASISDSHIGTLIIDFSSIWSAFVTGATTNRFGAHNMILWGLAGTFVMSVLMNIAFVVDVSAFHCFHCSVCDRGRSDSGSLVWAMMADISPDSIRASASSLCIGINWLCNLISMKLVTETSGKSAEEILTEYDSRRDK